MGTQERVSFGLTEEANEENRSNSRTGGVEGHEVAKIQGAIDFYFPRVRLLVRHQALLPVVVLMMEFR